MFRGQDTINGSEGRGFTNIDGANEEMYYAKKIEAKIEKIKGEVRTINNRGTQHKASGFKGSGSMAIYYCSPVFRSMLKKYMTTGKDTYFDMQVINDDPSSSVGKQTTVLKNVNINGAVVALLDSDATSLEETVEFTFDDIEYLDEFGKPVLG